MKILRKIVDMMDTSFENFLSKLYTCIMRDKIQNSFQDFEYTTFYKNKLYKAIESYKNNQTIFYADFLAKHPEINIKRIGEIKIGEHVYYKGRGAYPTGTHYLKFTVYYEKKV